MANLRVFLSSTAYDLAVLRSSVRGFIEGLGYSAVLSDYSDVLYDPREHAHTSCLAEVRTCDMVVLVIGSRFGSQLAADVLATSTRQLDGKDLLVEEDGQISVTQAEALTAAHEGIPLFAFVEANVYHDYTVYQRNKGKPFASEILYPSIAQPETAEYIFNFIDYLQGRSLNNAVITFDRLEDLISHLQKQWAALFQRMLSETRSRNEEGLRIDRLADQFDDLRAALLATVGDASSRGAARSVIRYRRLLDFMKQLPNSGVPMREAVVSADLGFWQMLHDTSGIVNVVEASRDTRDRSGPVGSILELETGERLSCRYSLNFLDQMERDWQNLRSLSPQERGAVYDAVMDSDDGVRGLIVRRLPATPDPSEEFSREIDELLSGKGGPPRGELGAQGPEESSS